MKAITTQYHAARYRYSACDLDNNRVYVHKDDQKTTEENHAAACRALCVKMGWKGKLAMGYTKNNARIWVFITSSTGSGYVNRAETITIK